MADTKAENQTANADGSLDFLRQNLPNSPVAKVRKVVSDYAIARNETKFAKRWYDCVKESEVAYTEIKDASGAKFYMLYTYEETKGNPILNPQQTIKTEDKK